MARKRGKPRQKGGNRSQPETPSVAPLPAPDVAGATTFSLRTISVMVPVSAAAVIAIGLVLQFHGGNFGKSRCIQPGVVQRRLHT